MKRSLFAGLLAALGSMFTFGRKPVSITASDDEPYTSPILPREEYRPAYTEPGNRFSVSRPFGRRGRRKVARLSPGMRWILKTHRKARPWVGTMEGGAIQRHLDRERAANAALAHFGRIPQAQAA